MSEPEHIDRKELYTNLEARIKYLHAFLDFNSRDIQALATGAQYVKDVIPAVVHVVYGKILRFDITGQVFQTRSTRVEGPMEAIVSEDSSTIVHRKKFLQAYLKKLCSDPTKMEFWEYLDKVGMMHAGLGREPPLHVEYIHIGAALAVIHEILTEAVLSHPAMMMSRKISIVKAISKVIWIQNDLFARWACRDGEEFTNSIDYGMVEKEGWLNGKKVLNEDGSSQADSEAGGDGTCPFTGMSTKMGGLKVEDK